ncbi:MAG: phenylalanine--tRNA ligase subunit beta [Candidatus Omnitrophica bacterium]|nr:phenylalanine--tRNA ligase subunit beta [Candidatus Omnitrophota bacterium]
MKLSLNWLNQYIDHGLTADELSFRLTMAGLEVEAVEKIGSDTVFEIEITPNRPDCLSMLGLAREVSAIVDRELKVPAVAEHEDAGTVDIAIENSADCARYIGTRIDGVTVKPFPGDKSLLLQALGDNPVSNIVDITNFVLFEYGQPLHAFDFDKLEGGKIIVRRAKKGEKIVTLDDVERTLDESILVIADAKKPVAIAGIMGGRDSGVTSSTKRILLESASFDLGVTRRASRKLGLTSDACYRFERGIAWKTGEAASNRATDLILELAGGTVVSRRDEVASVPISQRTEVVVSLSDIHKLLGAPPALSEALQGRVEGLDLVRAEKILRRLGCVVAATDKTITVIPPHFRNDIKIKEDVIEEVARVVGYDNLPMSLPQVPAVNISVDYEKETFNSRLTGIFVGLGFNQVVTYSLVGGAALAKTNYQGPVIKLQNAMSAEQEMMRPTALPNMLIVAAANMNRGQRDLKLFEIGKRYLPGGEPFDSALKGLAQGERWTLSILVSGRREADWRAPKRLALDLFDIKGAAEEAFARLRVKGCVFSSAEDAAFEPGQAALVSIDGKPAGKAGKVAEEVLARFDIKKTAVYFGEVDLELAAEAMTPRLRFIELNEFPVVARDVSLSVKDGSFEAIKDLCFKNGSGLLKKINFVELYTGDKIETGRKGYVLSMTYQSSERTLTDDEVGAVHESIIQKLIETFSVTRR